MGSLLPQWTSVRVPVRARHTQGEGQPLRGAPGLDDHLWPLRPTLGALPFLRAPTWIWGTVAQGPDLPASPSLPGSPTATLVLGL